MLIERDKRGNSLQLLYSDEKFNVPANVYISGNKISVKTLDLNCDSSEIAAQLNHIVEQHFGLSTPPIS